LFVETVKKENIMTRLEKELYEDRLGLAGRSRALQKGKLTYIGDQCKKGHGGIKYVSDGRCVECSNDKSKMVNIDRIIARKLDQKRLDDMYL
jgi:hypothetical protein